MSEIIITIPDDLEKTIASQAEQQGLSVSAYIEKLLRVKNFTAALNTLREKIQDIIMENKIQTNDDLINYLKK